MTMVVMATGLSEEKKHNFKNDPLLKIPKAMQGRKNELRSTGPEGQ